MEKMLEIGRIVNTHGVRGEVKIEPWCDGDTFFNYIESVTIDGIHYQVRAHRPHKNHVLALLEGVDSMEKAEALKNKVLSVERERVELPEEQFLYSDLFGFTVFDERVGREVGKLADVQELPSSILYVIEGELGQFLVPAVDEFTKEIDFDCRVLRLRTIEGMLPNED